VSGALAEPEEAVDDTPMIGCANKLPANRRDIIPISTLFIF
jgi:hypothetical protein